MRQAARPRQPLPVRGLLAALLLALGCTSNVPVNDYTYVCATDADCAKGFTCIAKVCSTGSPAGADTSTGDTGTADTGTADTAAGPDAEDSPKCSTSDVTCLTNCGMSKCPILLYKCNEDKDCKAAMTCYAGCSDTPCRLKCLSGSSAGTKESLSALQDCLAKKCM
ncbi:MAG: hypothetical protein HY902_07220 [Deltaproteobacteria bacterium]|nr:hypothetical protein [Deltaproteobacteria bacterium]